MQVGYPWAVVNEQALAKPKASKGALPAFT